MLNFIVLAFIFMSMIHFELCLYVRYEDFIFLQVRVSCLSIIFW